jgi:hypothetical protein
MSLLFALIDKDLIFVFVWINCGLDILSFSPSLELSLSYDNTLVSGAKYLEKTRSVYQSINPARRRR